MRKLLVMLLAAGAMALGSGAAFAQGSDPVHGDGSAKMQAPAKAPDAGKPAESAAPPAPAAAAPKADEKSATVIETIKVTETVKEGATVFRLTAEEQRKADLMLKPDSRGDYAFARFLAAAAARREAAAVPSFGARPLALASMAPAQHDRSCLSPVLGDIVAALVGQQAGETH